jgi:outer membrane protein assembly factor BamE (lipoprotein component of BamABCDE complex)
MRALGEQGETNEPEGLGMRSKALRPPAILVLTLGLAAVGCAPTTQVHGYVPPSADVARIRPGVDTVATVEEILGLPTSTGLLRDSAWFYVQSVFESYTYNPPRVVDRTVLVVNFNPDGVVTGVERFGVEDGRIVNLTARTTETGGRQLGVLEQIFGNILNLDAEAFEQ